MSTSNSAPNAPVDLLNDAVAFLREAGEFTLQWFGAAQLDVITKNDGTPVTEADQGAERLLRTRIAEKFPTDTVRGEEEDDVIGTSTRTWIIDPIDGTKAFVRGVPLYSNLLGIVDEHGPLIGVINLPALNTTVYAGRGLGCFRNGEKVTVSKQTDPRKSVLSSSSFTHWPEESLLALKRKGFELRTWGDGYGYAMVACGAIEAMIDPEVALWDLAPLPVIMQEAGGSFSKTNGQSVVLQPGDRFSAVATNGYFHDEIIAAYNA